MNQSKIIWWLRSPAIILLMTLVILLNAVPQLVNPAIGLELNWIGSSHHYGILLGVNITCQVIASFVQPRLVNLWGSKLLLQRAIIGLFIGNVLLAVGILQGWVVLYYLSGCIRPGCGMIAVMTAMFMVRTKLGKKDYLSNISAINVASKLAVSGCTFLCFQLSRQIWGWFIVFATIGIYLMSCRTEEPNEQNLPQAKSDPKKTRWNTPTLIAIGWLPVGMMVYCVPVLLPLTMEENVDVLLLILLVGAAALPNVMAQLINKWGWLTLYLHLACRIASVCGLYLILSGGEWWAMVGAGLASLGHAELTLVRSATYVRDRDRHNVWANAMPDVVMNISALIGAIYSAIFGWMDGKEGYVIALQWLFLPAAVAVITALVPPIAFIVRHYNPDSQKER